MVLSAAGAPPNTGQTYLELLIQDTQARKHTTSVSWRSPSGTWQTC